MTDQTKTIGLSMGLTAVVDAIDFDALDGIGGWYAHIRRGKAYAVRCLPRDRKTQRTQTMHQVVAQLMGLVIPAGHVIDHKNGDGLDNRRANLRAATRAQNGQNSKMYKSNSTGFRGVSFHRGTGCYRATIRIDGKQKSLGYRSTPEEAHALYAEYAQNHFGEFNRSTNGHQ